MALFKCCLLSAIFLLISADNTIWQDYPFYDCELTTSAFEVKYLLSLSECKETCANTASCKGISWYQYLKPDVPIDPARCYLLDKVCDLQYYNSSPAVSSFWYSNISSHTECMTYPFLWSDKYADDCTYYSKFKVCDNSFNDSSKGFILTDYDSIYNFNAFQVCCSCYGSIFEYKPSEVSFILESVWKPPHQTNIIDSMVCQSYDPHITSKTHNLHNKWDINSFLGICNHLSLKAQYKFSSIYSIADNQYQNIQSMDYKTFANFDCINDIFFVDQTVTFYVCNEFDFTNYPYVIDLNGNHTVYLNGYYIYLNDFISNIKNNKVIFQNKCNIEPLINNNNDSNIIASLLCEYHTDSPTQYPTIEPTQPPTTSEPTNDPTLAPTSAPTFSPTDYPTYSPTPAVVYSDKSQITAFCLTFFFGVFGAGRWYIGEEIGAAFQLVLFVCSCCFGGVAVFLANGSGPRVSIGGVGACICFVLFVWWIVDLVMIGENTLSDTDDMPLEPW